MKNIKKRKAQLMELTDGIDQVVDVGYNKMLSGNKDFLGYWFLHQNHKC